MIQGYSEVKLGKGDEEPWIMGPFGQISYSPFMADRLVMKYIIDPLVLCYNRFFFVYVFFLCFHGCLRSIFCGFGAYYACVLEHLDLVFLFYPSSDLEFFFLVCCHVNTIYADARESGPF